MGKEVIKKEMPSLDQWIKEAKASVGAEKSGMYLFHNGIVRETAKAKVREGKEDTQPVKGMLFSYDQELVNQMIEAALQLKGINYARVWLNEGELTIGDNIMLVLIGGDIRPHVVDALQYLVGRIKNECVKEIELY